MRAGAEALELRAVAAAGEGFHRVALQASRFFGPGGHYRRSPGGGGDKQSLFRALIDEQLEQIRRFTAPIDWQAGDAPEPERALYERLLLIFELIHAHQAVFRLTVREARARNPETEDRVREVQREILSAMAAEFRAGTRAGHFLCPDPEFTAAYLLGGILEIVEWNLFIAERPLDPEALARKVTDLQLRVLLPDAGGEAAARPPKLGEPR